MDKKNRVETILALILGRYIIIIIIIIIII
jgi:hypothetical protein